MNAEHSKLFPFSSAHRWTGTACPGSILLCADIPDEDSEISREGTAAHWVLEVMLNAFKKRIDHDGFSAGQQLIGVACPSNGVIVDESMFDGALTAYNKVIDIVGTDPSDKERLLVEFRVGAPSIDPEAWGTADVIFYDTKTNTLYIWDFKYGFRSVKAFENDQLIGYAQATVETLNIDALNPRLSLNIIQPRCYDGRGALRNWTTSYDLLRSHVNIMRHGVGLYREGKAECQTGDWCYECRGRHKCQAFGQVAATAIEYSSQSIPHDLTDEALGFELSIAGTALSRLEQRVAALKAEAEQRIRSGKTIPGKRLAQGVGKRAWSVADGEVFMMGELFGVNLRAPIKPMTPAAAERELKKNGIDVSVISPYHHKPKTGVKLVDDDMSFTAEIFSQEKI